MKNKITIVGLTGSIACGKNAVASIMEAHGFLHIDADRVYHELLEKNQALRINIKKAFGPKIFNNNQVNRKALGKIVYNSPEKMKLLTDITHPIILKKILELTEASLQPCVINAALLIEMGLHKLCSLVIVVDVSKDIQIKRLCLRDNINPEYASTKIKSQADNSLKQKYADHIIENNASLEELEAKVRVFIESKGY